MLIGLGVVALFMLLYYRLAGLLAVIALFIYTTITLTLYKLSAFAPGYTMAAAIANEFAEAVGDMHLSSLAYVALALFAVTVVVNAGARLLIWRVARGSGAGSSAL